MMRCNRGCDTQTLTKHGSVTRKEHIPATFGPQARTASSAAAVVQCSSTLVIAELAYAFSKMNQELCLAFAGVETLYRSDNFTDKFQLPDFCRFRPEKESKSQSSFQEIYEGKIIFTMRSFGKRSLSSLRHGKNASSWVISPWPVRSATSPCRLSIMSC